VRLGKRSARVGARGRGQLIRLVAALSVVLAAPAGASIPAPDPTTVDSPAADSPTADSPMAATTTVGPARIVCNATFCEMGSGARPKERVRVIVSNLAQEEIHRLRKCTGVAKPCIVTIEGTQLGGPMRIMASSIRWQE
jgi:hypothetical protein